MSQLCFTLTFFVVFLQEELSQLFKALIYLPIDSSYRMDAGFATLLVNAMVIWNNFPCGCCTILQIKIIFTKVDFVQLDNWNQYNVFLNILYNSSKLLNMQHNLCGRLLRYELW